MPKPKFPAPVSPVCKSTETFANGGHNWSPTIGRLNENNTLEYSYHVCHVCGLYELYDF